MFDRLERSWRLAKASWEVLRADGELLILPLISGVVTLVVCGAMVWQASISGLLPAGDDGAPPTMTASLYVWLFAFYLVQYFIIIFFNTALVGAALERLRGGDPTVGSALRLAFSRIGPIFGFAIASATVGVILQAIAERLGIVGRLIAGGLGLGWAIATFLVVPVIAAEGGGPVEAIERSASLLKKTWGENIIGSAGISLVMSIIAFAIIVPGAGGGALLWQAGNQALAIPLLSGTFVLAVIVALVGATLSAIYAAAVYEYAVNGGPPEGFSRDLIRDAFAAKPAS